MIRTLSELFSHMRTRHVALGATLVLLVVSTATFIGTRPLDKACQGQAVTPADDLVAVINGTADATFCLAPGTYELGNDILRPGDRDQVIGAPVTVAPDGAIQAPTKIVGTGSAIVDLARATGVLLENLDVSGATGNKPKSDEGRNSGVGIVHGKNTTLQNLVSHDNANAGVKAFSGRVDNVELYANGSKAYTGISAAGIKSSRAFEVSSSYIHDNLGVGIWADIKAESLLVSGSVVVGNELAGVRWEHDDNIAGSAIIARNLIQSNGGGGVAIDSASSADITGNMFGGNVDAVTVEEDKNPVAGIAIYGNILGPEGDPSIPSDQLTVCNDTTVICYNNAETGTLPSPEPSVTPEASPSPEPSITPDPSPTPEPSPAPSPTESPSEPSPSPVPSAPATPAPGGEAAALPQGLVGFGAKTTGAQGGQEYWVTSLADSGPGSLREGAQSNEPLWIRFKVSGTINLRSPIDVSSDKTIDGRNADVTVSGSGFVLSRVSNVIFESLRFRDGHGADTDAIQLIDETKDVWIDHCDFSSFEDGLVDITRGATDVTVSWSQFTNHMKAMLINGEGSDGETVQYRPRVTVHHNYFAGNDARSPRALHGIVHAFNNYLVDWGSYGMHASENGVIVSEGNIFEAGDNKRALMTQPGEFDSGSGYAVSVGDVALNGAVIEPRQGSSIFDPASFYKYSVDEATSQLTSRIRTEAGLNSPGSP